MGSGLRQQSTGIHLATLALKNLIAPAGFPLGRGCNGRFTESC